MTPRDCVCPRARHQHGTEQAYISDACRCDPCKAAHAQRAAWRRRQYAYGRDIAHLTPTAGTTRRIEALMTLGWSAGALATRVGWEPVTVHRILQQARILASKAAAVAALYDQLWDQPPPETCCGERISAVRTRRLAQRRGYQPPMSWDDDEIDDPNAEPHTPTGSFPLDLHPCGTPSAARRHYRRGETLDEACRNAARRQRTDRKKAA